MIPITNKVHKSYVNITTVTFAKKKFEDKYTNDKKY